MGLILYHLINNSVQATSTFLYCLYVINYTGGRRKISTPLAYMTISSMYRDLSLILDSEY